MSGDLTLSFRHHASTSIGIHTHNVLSCCTCTIAHTRLDNHTVDFEPSKAEVGVSALIKPTAFASSFQKKNSTAVHSLLGLHHLAIVFMNSMAVNSSTLQLLFANSRAINLQRWIGKWDGNPRTIRKKKKLKNRKSLCSVSFNQLLKLLLHSTFGLPWHDFANLEPSKKRMSWKIVGCSFYFVYEPKYCKF